MQAKTRLFGAIDIPDDKIIVLEDKKIIRKEDVYNNKDTAMWRL